MSDNIIEQLAKACRRNEVSLIEPLLNMNPDLVNKPDSEMGWCPLHRSVLCEHAESTELLLKLGADVNKPANSGEAPIHIAAKNGDTQIVRLLLEHGADVNSVQKEGESALHIAAKANHQELVQLLLRSGANRFIQDKTFKKSPIDYAEDSTIRDMLSEPTTMLIDILRASNIEKIPSFRLSSNESLISKPSLRISVNEKLQKLLSWLKSYGLESLFKALVEAGYDDIDQMILQIDSPMPITEDTLEAIGVDKVGHRRRFLAALFENSYKKPAKRFRCFGCCSPPSPVHMELASSPSLERWLGNLNLAELLPLFCQAGFEELDQVIALIHTPWPIDSLVLKEIGVKNPHQRQCILTKIKEDSYSFKRLRKEGSFLTSDRGHLSDEVSTCQVM